MSTAFVTGANGFIAQHIVAQLLDAGYKVIGSVRSEDKGKALKADFHSDNFSYVVVANLGAKDAFVDALKAHPEVKYFLHTASPVDFTTKDPENDTLIPAVDGVKDVIASVHKYGKNVEKFVYTSSIVAVAPLDPSLSSDIVVTEESWSPITWEQSTKDPSSAYRGSKKYAELAAWEFLEKEKPSFTLSTINPPYVFGPQAHKSQVKDTLNATNELVHNLLRIKPEDDIPEFGFYYVDVRDVAKAHVLSLENKEIPGKRIITSSARFSSQDLVDIIHKKFPQYNGKIAKGEPGHSKTIGVSIDSSKSDKILGFKFIGLEKTITDLVQQIVEYENSKL